MAVRAIPLLQGVSRRLQALEEKGFLYSKSFLAFVSFKKKKKEKSNQTQNILFKKAHLYPLSLK